MEIPTQLLLNPLIELARLSPAHQQVFIWCAKHGYSVVRIADIEIIASRLSMHPRTVSRALHAIRQQGILSAIVKFASHRQSLIQEELL